ncbi:MAG TPA: hypothetical protein DCM67_02830 [Propionibacteriaceae bacterium]|nr:hypothetical protein [Propionibacteriaceae bacterium]
MHVWPSSPHLSVFVFTRNDVMASLAAVAGLLEGEGCTFVGRSVLAESGPFTSTSQLVGSEVVVDGTATDWLARLEGTDRMPISLAFHCPKVGSVALRLAASGAVDDPNPLEVCAQAAGLSIPARFRTSGERHRGKFLVSWSEYLMGAMLTAVDGEYSAIGIRAELPTPSQLDSLDPEDPLLPHTWLVPSRAENDRIATLDSLTDTPDPTKMAQALHTLRTRNEPA